MHSGLSEAALTLDSKETEANKIFIPRVGTNGLPWYRDPKLRLAAPHAARVPNNHGP